LYYRSYFLVEKIAMRRRSFLTLFGGAATAMRPVAVGTQRSEAQVIGLLHPGSADTNATNLAGLYEGLSETGLGRNIAIEYRWANNDYARLPQLAHNLVTRQVAVIAIPGSGQAAAAGRNQLHSDSLRRSRRSNSRRPCQRGDRVISPSRRALAAQRPLSFNNGVKSGPCERSKFWVIE
jgi:hypothetical protein